MVTRLVPVESIPSLVAQGRIGHSLVVVALYHFDLWRRGFNRNHAVGGPPPSRRLTA